MLRPELIRLLRSVEQELDTRLGLLSEKQLKEGWVHLRAAMGGLESFIEGENTLHMETAIVTIVTNLFLVIHGEIATRSTVVALEAAAS